MPRTELCLPIDVARTLFDTTVTQAQINANTFQNSSGDRDLLLSMIEDAESEFYDAVSDQMKVGTVGLPGTRETYEQVTYDVSGHEQYKRTWTGTGGGYRNTERTTNLQKSRILPFDPAEGDEAYLYRGMATANSSDDGWEDVTADQGDIWDIVNNREGRITLSPVAIEQSTRGSNHGLSVAGRNRLREVRLAITYRYGALGGSRSTTAETTLVNSLSQGTTGTVDIGDGTRAPSTSEVVVKIEDEYLSVTFDPDADTMTILERGVRGTTDSAHDADDVVFYAPPSVRKAVAAHAAENLVTSSRYSDWLPDTEDDIDKGDMLDQFSDIWTTTISALS